MNTFMKILFLGALTLLSSSAVLAKGIKVAIQADEATAKEVGKSIAARLQGTDRYEVTDGDAELYVHLSCMAGKEVSTVSGYICSFVFLYYPEQIGSMESCLSPYGLVTGRDVSSVAENVFISFVKATTAERLEKARKELRVSVIRYCHSSIVDKNVIADCKHK